MFAFVCFSQTAEEYYMSGIEKSKNQDYSAAIVDFTEAIKLNPQYSEAFYARGLAFDSKKPTLEGFKDVSMAFMLGSLEAEKYIIKVSDYMKISKEYLNSLREQRDNLYKFSLTVHSQLNILRNGEFNVINPTLNNIKILTSYSKDEFETTMSNNRYVVFDAMSDHKSSTYTTINNLNAMMKGCANYICYYTLDKGKISFFVSKDQVYPNNAINNLVSELSEYFYDTTNEGADRFIIWNSKNESEYIITITTTGDNYYIIGRKCINDYMKSMFKRK